MGRWRLVEHDGGWWLCQSERAAEARALFEAVEEHASAVFHGEIPGDSPAPTMPVWLVKVEGGPADLTFEAPAFASGGPGGGAVSPAEAEIEAGFAAIDEVLANLGGTVFDAETMELAREAIEALEFRTDEDVHAWAARLAVQAARDA